MEALAKRGASTELVDLSEFPTRLALSMQFDRSSQFVYIELAIGQPITAALAAHLDNAAGRG
jgi:hypothetical protein